ncbi:ABC transporter substrate-binding protein [Endothiovibrio diazotrophicus]
MNKNLLIVWLISLLSLATVAVGAEERPAPPVNVAVSVTPLSAPFLLADDYGDFAAEGLEVRLHEVIGGHRTARMLFDGEADIATSSEVVAMFNSFKRRDFRLFCTFVSSTNDVKLLTRSDSGIDAIEGLAGHRVGTVTGASAHFFLDEVAALSGVDPARLEVIHIAPEETGDALIRGRVDAVAMWEPWIHLARQRFGPAVRLLPHDRPYIETFNALVMEGYARDHPQVLEKVTRALIRAVQRLRAQPQPSIARVAARLKMNPAVVAAVWRDLDFDVTLNQSLLNTMESEARWAIDRKLVDGDTLPNYLDLLYLPALRRVAPEKVGIF